MAAEEPLVRKVCADFQALLGSSGAYLELLGVEDGVAHLSYRRPGGAECDACVLTDEDLTEMMRERITAEVPGVTAVQLHLTAI